MRPPPGTDGRWWPTIQAVSREDPAKTVTVKVSRKDYEYLKRFKWREEEKTGYIYRRTSIKRKGKRIGIWISMHREVLGLPPFKKDRLRTKDIITGKEVWLQNSVDHRNRDIRDNRRTNLEHTTHKENMHRWMREDGRMAETEAQA